MYASFQRGVIKILSMNDYIIRYQRQIILQEFGNNAQRKLADAKVLVIGAGGLGCPALQYLVAAGVGHIGIADNDVVHLSNLHRQILFGSDDIGKKKVIVAKERLLQLNNLVTIEIYDIAFKQAHCIQYFPLYDIIIDATDNFSSRYLINDACYLCKKPLIFGAVSKFEGQLAIFNHTNDACNYRDVFPDPTGFSDIADCATGGVIGVLPGIIGVMQATEAIKLITGVGKPLENQLLNYNVLSQTIYTVILNKHPEAAEKMPKNFDEFMKINYEVLCQ